MPVAGDSPFFPPSATIQNNFNAWCRDGTFDRMMDVRRAFGRELAAAVDTQSAETTETGGPAPTLRQPLRDGSVLVAA